MSAGDAQRRPLAEHIADASALLGPLLAPEPATLGPACVGRTARSGRRARVDVPAAANSQMDGFAVRVQDLRDAEGAGGAVELAQGRLIAAGDAPGELAPGSARPIMTGAPLPAGAELVIPVEESARGVFDLDAASVELRPRERTPGRFVRERGSDTAAGDEILRPGDVLAPGRIAHLAACGITDVDVAAPVRVAVVSTGSEVTAPGAPLPAGGAFDANGPGLVAALAGAGAEVVACARVADDPQALVDLARAAVREQGAQLIVTSGGVSRGAVEPVRLAAQLPGVDLVFTSLAIQPGGPQGLGRIEVDGARIPWIALPGNPVSALLSCELILRPALAAPPRTRLRLPLRLEDPEGSPAHLEQFRRARVLPSGAVRLVGGASSHLVGALARADALVVVPVGVDRIADGDRLETILLPGGER